MTKKKPKDTALEDAGARAPASVGIEAPSDGGVLNRKAFALENLIGEVADEKLADMKAARNLKPWELLSEEEQRDMIEQARARAHDEVERIVEALAVRGFPTYVAQVGGYQGKMGSRTVKLTVEVPAENFDPERLSGSAFLVFASAALYGSEMQAKPQANQPLLKDDDGDIIDPSTGEIVGERIAPEDQSLGGPGA